MPIIDFKCPRCSFINKCGDFLPPNKNVCKNCNKVMSKLEEKRNEVSNTNKLREMKKDKCMDIATFDKKNKLAVDGKDVTQVVKAIRENV